MSKLCVGDKEIVLCCILDEARSIFVSYVTFCVGAEDVGMEVRVGHR